jgi:hypothetical protein
MHLIFEDILYPWTLFLKKKYSFLDNLFIVWLNKKLILINKKFSKDNQVSERERLQMRTSSSQVLFSLNESSSKGLQVLK